MTSRIAPLAEALDALAAAWAAGGAEEPRGLTDADLLAVNERFGALRRQVEGAHASIAAEIASRSRAELGRDSLARRTGHRSPAKLIASATGGHSGDAARLIHVGRVTAPRLLLSGEAAPPPRPHIAAALAAGQLGVGAAAAIAAMLDRVAMRVDLATRDAAERTIVAQAPQLTLEELQAVLRRAEAHLDPDGLEPRVEELRHERSLKISQDAAGMTVLNARLDPATAAPIVAAIDGIVTTQLRRSRGRNLLPAAEVDVAETAPPHGSPSETVADESRSLAQMRADALEAICRHVTGCDTSTLPRETMKVVVRMDLADIRSGTGLATIDGMEHPLDVGTARRAAASAEIVPCVLGGASQPLDLGRAQRHFSAGQRLVLVERDGGCAFCHLPPGYTEAHHLRWWTRDRGPTDLRNAILLCTACHHRVHDEGWEIRIDAPPGVDPGGVGDTVWFVPPAHLDASRTPRLGGRRRFDPLLWSPAA